MPAVRYFSPEDTTEQKLQIERRLGRVKACKYFNILERFLSFKISKREFDRICIATIGRENVPLHNHFLKSILKKACLSKAALPRESKVEGSLKVKMPNGCSNLQSLCKDFPQSPRRGRTPNLRDRRSRDRPSPLGPHGKNNSVGCEDSTPKIHEQQSNIDLHSTGGRLPLSAENGEEVDQDSEILSLYKRSPVRAPLAIPTYNRRPRKYLCQGLSSATVNDTCQSIGQLPDTCSLEKRLEQKLEMEGLKISMDAAILLNNALDVYLKRLIKPCLDLAASKSVNKFSGPIQPGLNELQRSRYAQKPLGSASASISDFRTALELNPTILGEDWSLNLEKICLHASEE
ncbi:SAGA-type complex [Spatholobus suberectus]|nr:SAGA-type complex [Spatholobus suberectus]